jgi:hypothetical protein
MRRIPRELVVGALLLLVIAAILAAVFGPIADLIAAHDVGSLTGFQRAVHLPTARDAARGRLLQLAGLFTLIVVLFNARSFFLQRQGLVLDRYTKAIEQLGSKELEVRSGGIYALERIARDDASYQPTVMAVLAAYIREHSREQEPPTEAEHAVPHGQVAKQTTHHDVQAALTVIGRRNARYDLEALDLGDVDLTGTTFHEGVPVPRRWVRDAHSGRLKRAPDEPSDAS